MTNYLRQEKRIRMACDHDHDHAVESVAILFSLFYYCYLI